MYHPRSLLSQMHTTNYMPIIMEKERPIYEKNSEPIGGGASSFESATDRIQSPKGNNSETFFRLKQISLSIHCLHVAHPMTSTI